MTRLLNLLGCVAVMLVTVNAFASTSEFTYQGQLRDNNTPANANYDFQFTLYDALSAGNVCGGPLTVSSVSVANGLFTVTLDFGSPVFTGADRFLEISVKAAGGASFTTLTPRQKLTNTPYAIKAKSALDTTGLGGQLVSTAVPTTNQILRFNGSQWVASNESGGSPTGAAGGDLGGNYPNPTISSVGGVTAANVANGANAANAATSSNTINSIVSRDSSGNFSANIISATLNGTAGNANSLNNQPDTYYLDAGNLTGNLNDARLSTNVTRAGNTFNQPGTLVQLDAGGKLPILDGSALTNVPVTGAAGGDLSGNYPNPTVASVGGATAANVAAGANLANAATDLNTNSAIVKRDGSGNFSAGTISASLNGTASNASALNNQAASFYLNATNISAGTLNDLRLSSNVVLKSANNIFTIGNQEIRTGADGNIGLIIKANSGTQGANLQEWQDSVGTAVASVSATGVFTGNGSGLTNVTDNTKANQALSNLNTVAINTSLLSGATNSIDLGSNTKNWRQLFVGGNGVTFEGTTQDANRLTLNVIDPTGPRTINLPDSNGTVALKDVDNNFSTTQTFQANAAQGDKFITSINAGTTAINDSRLTNNIALLSGRGGGQTLAGGTAASESLVLESTSNVTKGSILIAPSSGNVGIGTNNPTSTLALGGNAPRTIKMERDSGGNNGSDLTVAAGGGTGGAADKNGGNLILSSGIATGNGTSAIGFQVVKSGQGGGSTDRVPATAMVLSGNGRLGIGTTNPSTLIGLNGDVPQAVGMERNTIGNTQGGNLLVSAGGATPGASDKNGGDLVLSAGTATGNGGSNIVFQTAKVGQGGGSADRNPATVMTLTGSGDLIVSGAVKMNGPSLNTTVHGGNFNIDDTHGICLLTAPGVTATLPSASGRTGRLYTIKMVASGAACTVNSSGGNIDGNGAYSLASQFKYVTVVSDGINWFVVANN